MLKCFDVVELELTSIPACQHASCKGRATSVGEAIDIMCNEHNHPPDQARLRSWYPPWQSTSSKEEEMDFSTVRVI